MKDKEVIPEISMVTFEFDEKLDESCVSTCFKKVGYF